MNKDIIRAHNEVMLVIGVAEQDPGASNTTEADTARLHNEYENSTGRLFLRLGRVFVVAGIWGVHGIRQRILVRSVISERVSHSFSHGIRSTGKQPLSHS